jgi:hypothetical protein
LFSLLSPTSVDKTAEDCRGDLTVIGRFVTEIEFLDLKVSLDLFVLTCDMDTVFAVLFWLGILKSSTAGYILGPFWTLVIWSVLYNICFEQIYDIMFTDLNMSTNISP